MNEKERKLLNDEELDNVTGGAGGTGGPGKPPKFSVYDQVRIRANGNMGFVDKIFPERSTYSYELNDIPGRWKQDELERA